MSKALTETLNTPRDNLTSTSSTPIKSGQDEQVDLLELKRNALRPVSTSRKQGLVAGKGEKQLRKLWLKLNWKSREDK